MSTTLHYEKNMSTPATMVDSHSRQVCPTPTLALLCKFGMNGLFTSVLTFKAVHSHDAFLTDPVLISSLTTFEILIS